MVHNKMSNISLPQLFSQGANINLTDVVVCRSIHRFLDLEVTCHLDPMTCIKWNLTVRQNYNIVGGGPPFHQEKLILKVFAKKGVLDHN